MCPHPTEPIINNNAGIMAAISRLLSARCVQIFCFTLNNINNNVTFCWDCYYILDGPAGFHHIHFHGIIFNGGIEHQPCSRCGISVVKNRYVFDCPVCHPEYLRVMDHLGNNAGRVAHLIYDSIHSRFVTTVLRSLDYNSSDSE